MTQRVYIETTIVSYLTARPSRDIIIAGHQQITQEWWDKRRSSFELCMSQVVLTEAEAGDVLAAEERLAVLKTMAFLETSDQAVELARELIREGALPTKASNDALHIAVAAMNGIPFLLTWNCRHLANANMRSLIEAVCAKKFVDAPIICTPEELLGD